MIGWFYQRTDNMKALKTRGWVDLYTWQFQMLFLQMVIATTEQYKQPYPLQLLTKNSKVSEDRVYKWNLK